MSDQRIGWATAPLISLIAWDGLLTDGDWVESKDQDPNGNIRLLQLADIGDGMFLDKSARFINDKKFVDLRCTELTAGDVLVARMPDPLGRACLMPSLPQRCVTVVDVAALRPGSQSVLPSWLMRTINAPQFREAMAQQASGTTRKRISRSNLAALPVPVPPLPEQQRIADKLDTVLTRVDACRDRLARVAPLLKRFRQSVLAAATSGRLTEDWRGSDARPWASVTVENLCASISDGPFGSHLKSDDYTGQGARVVRLENIGHLIFDSSKETFISMAKYAALDRHTLIHGDLLFSSFVDEEVRVCTFPGDLGAPAINKADCFCLRVNREACDPDYLMYRLACKTTYLSLKQQVHGATRPRINLGQLRRFGLLLPPMAEQTEIVRRVDTLFAFADRLEERLARAQTTVDRLTPSLLAKAFRGELVPQDPADEPAAELLRRLAASRTATTAKTRKPRQGQPA